VQKSFGACLPSSCYLRAEAEETLDASELAHPHAEINDNQVGVLAQVYGSSINPRSHPFLLSQIEHA
jgi:hypothetical protein